jgi:CBS domain-containing protein
MADQIRDIMTTDVTTIGPEATAMDAARLMRDQDIGDVIVADGDRPIGIVTDRDLVIRALADGKDGGAPVGEVCSRDLTTVTPEDGVDRAISAMRDKAVRRLPVVDDGRLVGVVSLGDLAIEQDPRSALADISSEPANN